MTVVDAKRRTGKESQVLPQLLQFDVSCAGKRFLRTQLSRHPSTGERLFSLATPAELCRGGNVRISSHSLKEGGRLSPLALGGAHLLRDSMRDLGHTAIPNQGKQASLTTDIPVAATETLDLRWYQEGTTDHDTRRPLKRAFLHTQN